MKIHWGHKLVFFAILFMVFIFSMVYYMTQQNVELVDSDYYEKGIKYQEVIDQQKGADKMLEVGYDGNRNDNNTEGNKIYFAPLVKFDSTKVIVSLYRPSDKSKDFSFDFILNDSDRAIYPTDQLAKGNWKVNVKWEDSTGKHLIEKEFTFK